MAVVSVVTKPAYNDAQRKAARAEIRKAGYKIVSEMVTPIGLKIWFVPMETRNQALETPSQHGLDYGDI